MQVAAIIAGGGEGRRFSSKVRKQFLEIKNKPVLAHSIYPFENSGIINEIVVVVPKNSTELAKKEIVAGYHYKKVSCVVAGGEKRQDSVWEGLKNLKQKPDYVYIHDGARPFIKISDIEKSFLDVQKYSALIFAVRAGNTIKRVGKDLVIVETLNREELWEAQTPQVFRFDLIKDAFQKAYSEKFYSTDDSSLLERLGKKVKIFQGSPLNIKITFESDLDFAKAIMENWSF